MILLFYYCRIPEFRFLFGCAAISRHSQACAAVWPGTQGVCWRPAQTAQPSSPQPWIPWKPLASQPRHRQQPSKLNTRCRRKSKPRPQRPRRHTREQVLSAARVGGGIGLWMRRVAKSTRPFTKEAHGIVFAASYQDRSPLLFPPHPILNWGEEWCRTTNGGGKASRPHQKLTWPARKLRLEAHTCT